MLALRIFSLRATINSSKQVKTALLSLGLVYLLLLWSEYNCPHHPDSLPANRLLCHYSLACYWEYKTSKFSRATFWMQANKWANIYNCCFYHRSVLVGKGELSQQKIKQAGVYTSAVWTMVPCSSFLKTSLQRSSIEQRPGTLPNPIVHRTALLQEGRKQSKHQWYRGKNTAPSYQYSGQDTHTLPHTAHFCALILSQPPKHTSRT